MVAGSDTHQWLQVGCVCNLLDQDCNTIGELKACLQSGRCTTESAPMIGLQLKSAEAGLACRHRLYPKVFCYNKQPKIETQILPDMM